ncbi:hypothetical protein [Spirulina sp. 06S082]|uniref:hypothetical protein n=1 Tax=Spirulina sp. 06S082 TaxID=3110248 RepID=UPI002B1EF8CD|nr:hypothetical protein [Spirulina sp. 06S082]MEA5468528.1 hypothetical protein [Spirulina sp. 06S082]
MVTYKTKKAKQGNYLTPKTNTGKKALKYLHKYCEKTLAYCQQQGLTTLEDFAEALESISEEDNPKLKIAVEVNTGGIAMKLANKPELGTTTGKYMMQHLGFDEEEQGKFIRTGIEQALNPEREREDEEEIDDLLDSFEGETEESEDIGDRPDEAKPQRLRKEPRRVVSTPEKNSPQVPRGNGFIDYDSLLDRAAVVGAAAANQGNELDGANLNGVTFSPVKSKIMTGASLPHE